MTNVDHNLLAIRLADMYLSALDNDDLDFEPHDVLVDLTHLLPKTVIEPMFITLDMCPVHYCDVQICLDDNYSECQRPNLR
jgi:hypothetical protein